MKGFEPSTPASRTQYSTKLSYTPTSWNKNPRGKPRIFLFRGKAARTATQGERLPAPLEHPQAKSPTRQAAGKSLRIIPIIWRE